jgi:hypothetical protein
VARHLPHIDRPLQSTRSISLKISRSVSCCYETGNTVGFSNSREVELSFDSAVLGWRISKVSPTPASTCRFPPVNYCRVGACFQALV